MPAPTARAPLACLLTACLAVAWLSHPAAARGDSRVFIAAADSYVSSAEPTDNRGHSHVLKVDADPAATAYVVFDVQLPVGAEITAAALILHTTSPATAKGVEAYAVPDVRWTETSLTYANAPARGQRLGASGPWSAPGQRALALAPEAVHAGLNAIAISTTTAYAKSFSAREGTSAPELTVTFSPPAAPAPLAPADGALLGAWHKNQPTGAWSAAEFARFESLVGRAMDIDHRFAAWGSTYWPGTAERWDADSGRIPMISLGGRTAFPGLDAVVTGSQDGYLAQVAERVKAFQAPLLLRPLWEMNGGWARWGGVQNNSPGETDGPGKYVAAWRRMHDIFTEHGALNAVWVWSPNCIDNPAVAWNHWTSYYPGDAYVDWVACDGYNWGTSTPFSAWRSWASVFGGSSSVYSDYATKPFMVAETGSCEQGGDKAAWLRDVRRDITASFQRVKAFVYFDSFSEQELGCDWRVTSSPAALDAFRELAEDPYFSGGRQPLRPAA